MERKKTPKIHNYICFSVAETESIEMHASKALIRPLQDPCLDIQRVKMCCIFTGERAASVVRLGVSCICLLAAVFRLTVMEIFN